MNAPTHDALAVGTAGELIARRFPFLAPLGIEPFGSGVDNSAFLVNEEWVFRFPRNAGSARLLERECRILPILAGHLPLPVPVPVYVGEPSDAFPLPFAGYSRISGRTACSVAWTEALRTEAAAPLARFLAALHAVPLDSETRAWAPGDDFRKTYLRERLPHLERSLRAVPLLPGVEIQAVLRLADDLASTPPLARDSCWLHGDLYARHVLVDDALRPCGIIDWGDVHVGDPALDLSIAYSFLPPGGRECFRAEYGPIDDATRARARFRALFYGAVLRQMGIEQGDTGLQRAGEYALRFALEG